MERWEIQELLYKDDSVIVLCSFHVYHTQSRIVSPMDRVFYQVALSSQVSCFSKRKPTYWLTDTNKVPNCIELFLLHKLLLNYIEVNTIFDLYSDHIPISLRISNVIQLRQKPTPLISKYTDWGRFREEVLNAIDLCWSLKTKEELETATSSITQTLITAAQNATPLTSCKVTPHIKYSHSVYSLLGQNTMI